MMTIFKSIRNFFTGNKSSYDYDCAVSYANHAFIAFLDKFHKWEWKYKKWTVDLNADPKYTMEFVDNLGNHNVFSDSSIVGLNMQFNVHRKLVIKKPYKQTGKVKRFGRPKYNSKHVNNKHNNCVNECNEY